MAKLPQKISASIHQVAKQAIGRDWELYSILLQHWREIVGAEWAESAVPVKLIFPAVGQRVGGTLTVSVPRGLAMAAQYQVPQMLARINGFLGQTALARITLTHSLKAPPKLKPKPRDLTVAEQASIAAAAGKIADAELRESLAAYGAALIAADSGTPEQ